MSSSLVVKEVVNVSEKSTAYFPSLSNISTHLLWISNKLLLNDMSCVDIRFSCAGKEYRFSGTEITEDFQNLIRALEPADIMLNADSDTLGNIQNLSGEAEFGAESNPFSFSASFHVETRLYDDDFSGNLFDFCSMMRESAKKDPDNMFFSLYIDPLDKGEGVGELEAYGSLNGTAYNGTVEDREIHQFPATGKWVSPQSLFAYDPNYIEGLDVRSLDKKRIGEILEGLCQYSYDNDVTLEDDEISYIMNGFEGNSPEALNKLVILVGELIELTPGWGPIDIALLDEADIHGRTLRIHVESRDRFSMATAAI